MSIEIKAKNNLYYTTTTQDKEKAQNIEHRNERASQKIDTNKINKEKAQKIEHRNHRWISDTSEGTLYKEKAQKIEHRNRQDFPPYYSEE